MQCRGGRVTQIAQGDARGAFPQWHRGVHAREFRPALLQGSQALQCHERGRSPSRLCVIAGQPSGSKKITKAERKSGVEQIVGSVNESRQAHLERCRVQGCPRCRWYLVGHTWQATYGSLEVEAGPRGKTIWLSERPAKWKGAWALGCTLCAEALAGRQVLGDTAGTQQSRGSARKNCSWARFEVRSSSLQAEHVKQHACSDCHKLAVQAWPDAPVRLYLQVAILTTFCFVER